MLLKRIQRPRHRAQVRKRTSRKIHLCNPRLGRICVGIVGHLLERRVVETMLAAFADPTTRQLLAEPDPHLVTAVTTELRNKGHHRQKYIRVSSRRRQR